MELAEMMIIASRLQARVDEGEFPDFRAMVSSLTPADRLRLGEEYIERTRVHRQTDKPLFIDKMPNNWQHVGLIRLILPNAKIVDARRHPMACCFPAGSSISRAGRRSRMILATSAGTMPITSR
jgi:hypothetical protein